MTIYTFERNASTTEMAVEMDRRGAVIERLEAERDTLTAALAAEKARADEAEAKWKAAAEAAVRRQREIERLTIANKNLGEISHENRERAKTVEARCDTLAGALADDDRLIGQYLDPGVIPLGSDDYRALTAARTRWHALATIPAKPETQP